MSLKPATHYPHVTFYVLFSTPSLFLSVPWLSYVALYNLVTWCHVKRSVGAVFNKHFLHFWKQLVTMKSTRHVRHVSRNVSDNRNLKGRGHTILTSRELTRSGRSRPIFQGEKIPSTPSFGGEVKPSVPCRRFTACKRSLNVTWKSAFRQNFRLRFLAL
jgi:hypothetical protein